MVMLFKSKKRVFLIIGIACIFILGAFLLTNPVTNQSSGESGDKTELGDDKAAGVIITDRLQLEPLNPQSIDEAVSLAVKGQDSYAEGEVATEGHIILDTKEKDGKVITYTVASFGYFGFENGIFTKVSGSGAIPTVLTFARDENGGYALLEYQEPMDGAGYNQSIRKMFPPGLLSRVQSGDNYPQLAAQQETQAAEYLKGIGREAPVSVGHVEKTLANIDVQASNKLFAEFTKFNAFLNSCPYWIGSLERIEDGVRYIYETSQSKTEDGYDLITFEKKKEDGTVVKESRFKIVGSEPLLVT